jgi:hypothetical protein
MGDAGAQQLTCVGDIKNCGDPAVYSRCTAQQSQCDTYTKSEWTSNMNAAGTVDDNIYVHAKSTSVAPGGKLGTQPKENQFNAAKVHKNYGISATPASHSPQQSGQTSTPLPSNSRRSQAQNPTNHAHSSTQNTWAAQETKARIDALQVAVPSGPMRQAGTQPGVAPVVDPNVASQYVRRSAPASMAVTTCEDILYNKYYDEERWLDAIYRCAGDTRCETAVSLMSATPGIAGHPLHQRNEPVVGGVGPTIPASSSDFSQSAEMRGAIPRNAFFATGFFLPDALVTAFGGASTTKGAQVQALINAVRNGVTTYELGGVVSGGGRLGNNAQGFHDEWDFHRTMLARTAANKPGDFGEFELRNAAILDAMGAFYTQAACATSAAGCSPTTPSAVGSIVAGSRTWEKDAFVARAVYGNVDRTNATNMGAFFAARPGLKAALDDGEDPGGGLSFPALKGRGSTPVPAAPTTGAMAITQVLSPAVDNSPSPYLQSEWAAHPPRVDPTATYARLDCGALAPIPPMQLGAAKMIGAASSSMRSAPQATRVAFERFTGDYAACLTVNQILDEWARQSVSPSCFDPNNYACDWSPHSFVKRWVNNYVGYQGDKKEKDYQYCRENKGFLERQNSYTSAKAADDFVEAAVKKERKAIGKTPVRSTNTFGQQKSNHEVFGNDTVGAGYNYDFDWEVKVLDFFKQDTAHPKITNTPCNIGGHVKGSFDAYVYAFGSDDEKLVDASVALKANDAGSEEGHFDGHLNFLGSELFEATPHNVTLNQAHSVSLLNKSDRDGHDWEIIDIPFWVAWVKVDVRVDIAWHYGADATADVRASAKSVCAALSSKDVFVKLTGRFTPETDLDFIATATASVAGIVGVQLEVDLTLLRLSLPIRSKASAEVRGNNEMASLAMTESLDMKIHAFDGRIYFYITGPFDARLFGWEVGNWEGSGYSPSLFRGSSHEIFLGDVGSGFN